jgi:hypothetical protein
MVFSLIAYILYFVANIAVFLWFADYGMDELVNEGFKVKHLICFILFAPLFIIVFTIVFGVFYAIELSKFIDKKIKIKKLFNKKLF